MQREDEMLQKKEAKYGLVVIGSVLLTISFLVFNVAMLGILVPSLISAASTLAVLFGIGLLGATLAVDLAAGVILIRKLYNYKGE